MSALVDYDYAVVRLVPRVHLEVFTNVGVVLHARQRRFLGVRFHRDAERLAAAAPHLDLHRVLRALAAYAHVCDGGAAAAPIGLLPPSERFHWLTAPRSAVLQCSAVHAGRSADPASALEALFAEYVSCVL